jgi:hypothetical protein
MELAVLKLQSQHILKYRSFMFMAIRQKKKNTNTHTKTQIRTGGRPNTNIRGGGGNFLLQV